MKFASGLLTIAILAFFTGVEVKAKPHSVNADIKVSVNGVDQQASVTKGDWCDDNCLLHCKCNEIAQTCVCDQGKNGTGSALQGKNVYRAGASCQCPNCCAGHYCDQGISNWGIKICVPNWWEGYNHRFLDVTLFKTFPGKMVHIFLFYIFLYSILYFLYFSIFLFKFWR